jgi:hypothetical protein
MRYQGYSQRSTVSWMGTTSPNSDKENAFVTISSNSAEMFTFGSQAQSLNTDLNNKQHTVASNPSTAQVPSDLRWSSSIGDERGDAQAIGANATEHLCGKLRETSITGDGSTCNVNKIESVSPSELTGSGETPEGSDGERPSFGLNTNRTLSFSAAFDSPERNEFAASPTPSLDGWSGSPEISRMASLNLSDTTPTAKSGARRAAGTATRRISNIQSIQRGAVWCLFGLY